MHQIIVYEIIMHNLDNTDMKILRALQADATRSAAQLSDEIGIASASCWRRIERLEQEGIIAAHEAVLDAKALGYEVEVSLRVTLDKTRTDAFDGFIAAARDIAEVNEIQTFLGRVDVRLNVLARDMAHYQQIYRDKILALPHISDIEALMLVSTVMDRQALPI
ncbi:AsnC family transcriptional regulator [Amylibacter marinus]|uniref:AsnC family transcriptional regulator n=1 Tax=Amylibacter marinus TaxID=1475483 RepID=A0ABQ5VTH8_9RHOB|nr:Lrp/AsnC family transcriptional regulator [Amylibacter marinus]GLQ34567.1 AsnC family transcriptional regulator [Amylibacter marinus]